jgi:hypothetical protein
MDEIPDQRLARNADQLWSNSVPVPLNPNMLISPLSLPRPKPDQVFGYSQAAFTEKELMTIDLLVDHQFGRSYAVPDEKFRFPFLDIEFKSQAKNGTRYVAIYQIAGTGAITLNGNMELIQRSFGKGSFDFDEPQFLSLTIDHAYAQINVHWISAPMDGGQYSFHVERLSRLRKLRTAPNAYRETVIREREEANPQRKQQYEV